MGIRWSWLAGAGAVALFAAFTALAARIVVPLPFTPVPVTLQVLAVVLAGLVLGPCRGAASQLAYLGAIAAGWPLDAAGLGPAAFAGPTAGYLLGFVPAAFVVGWLAETVAGRRTAARFLAALAGVAVIYVLGTSWLTVWLGGDVRKAWLLGAAPFVLVDVGKAVLAAAVAESGRALVESMR